MRINRLEKSKININKYEKKAYYFYYPLGLALMLLFLYFWQVNIARKGAGKPSTVKSSLLGSKKSLMDCVLSPIQCVERCSCGKQIIPKDRYARMRNVWCLPSTDTIHTWLKKVGFKNIKLLDTTKTTPQEQRATHWIGDNTQSIKDFLDPNNDDLTVEGLPAPLRAIFTCQK
jgi:hypothetical protein